MCKRIDLTGNIYNKLTVLRYKNTIKTRAWYECMCFCGNIIDVRSDSLKSGHTKSCGCHKVYALKSKSTNTFIPARIGLLLFIDINTARTIQGAKAPRKL